MNQALTYLGSLPAQTVVYNGHEYTGGNLAFAKSVDAKNPALNRLATLVKENEITAGKTTIQDEKEWNPFMRLDAEAIKCVVIMFCYSSEKLTLCFYSGLRQRAHPKPTSWPNSGR